jgi:hypothetical protein
MAASDEHNGIDWKSGGAANRYKKRYHGTPRNCRAGRDRGTGLNARHAVFVRNGIDTIA